MRKYTHPGTFPVTSRICTTQVTSVLPSPAGFKWVEFTNTDHRYIRISERAGGQTVPFPGYSVSPFCYYINQSPSPKPLPMKIQYN